MSDTTRNNDLLDSSGEVNSEHVSPDQVAGAHDADGTMGRVAGTGSGAISGGIVGGAVAGPVGAVVGAVAGAALGAAGGNAAHKVGDDHDDVNVNTGSGGDLGKHTGAGAGSISGAIVGGATAGPVGSVAGAVAGGMLGAAAGDAAKDFGGDNDNTDVSRADTTYAGTPGVMSNDVSSTTPFDNDVARTRSADDTIRVPVVEEDINVAKHTQQAGEVAVAKHVVQEQVNVPVQVTHEEVTINRVPVDRPVDASDRIVDEGDVIRVPLTEEVVTVDKEARVVEEIEIRKHAVTEQETVSDTVRREVVDVDDTTHTTNTGLTGHNTDQSGGRVL
jgi:uncharacterized protein (TIGR02271 family)